MPRRHLGNEADLEVTHIRASGPGGQNRNKRMSGVRVLHRPTGIVASATERRSQAQNLAQAMIRLEEKLARFFHRDQPRHATRPTKSSKQERLKKKTVHSKTKALRQKPRDTDW